MDIVRTIARRLTLLAFGALLAFSGSVMAGSCGGGSGIYCSEALAQAACVAFFVGRGNTGYNCYDVNPGSAAGYVHGDWLGQTWAFHYDSTGTPIYGNPCSGLAPMSTNIRYASGSTLGTTGATWETDSSSGLQLQCPFNISYSNYSAIADASGYFHVQATATYTGNAAGSGSTQTAGQSSYNDASGNPLSPQPTGTPTAPQICGGGSCIDTGTGQACGMSGTAQICVPLATGTNAAGGCASGGGATVCTGNPTAPSPVGTPGSTVTDPATQIQSSDKYTTGNPTTGAVGSTTVNVFSSTGSTSSGARTGALSSTGKTSSSTTTGTSTPASSSSSGGGDTFNGGGDCNTPPACTGDAVMCGVAQEQWRTMCSAKTSADALYKSVAGDGNGPPTLAADSTKYGQGDAWATADTSQSGTVGGQANNGVYDQSGFGFGTSCPLQDINVPFFSGSFAIPLSQGCVIGPWLRAIIIGFALFSAAVITAGGRG